MRGQQPRQKKAKDGKKKEKPIREMETVINRRDFLTKCAAAAGGFVLSNRALEIRIGARRPNIILCMCDDSLSGTDLHVINAWVCNPEPVAPTTLAIQVL